MNLDSFLQKALAMTVKRSDFRDMTMDDKQFSELVQQAQKLKSSVKSQYGEEGLEALCDALSQDDEWQEALDFFEAIFFDD